MHQIRYHGYLSRKPQYSTSGDLQQLEVQRHVVGQQIRRAIGEVPAIAAIIEQPWIVIPEIDIALVDRENESVLPMTSPLRPEHEILAMAVLQRPIEAVERKSP